MASPTPKTSGVTHPSQFRLGPETLARLDALVAADPAGAGNPNRSSVVRWLIHREHARQERAKAAQK